jgi:cysteine desulfurase
MLLPMQPSTIVEAMKPTTPATGERRITYLDHAATTPMCPQAVAAMTAQLTRLGNPSSLHGSGRGARRVVEEARETIGAAVGASPSEVVFTGGGTESNNVAVKGIYWARNAGGDRPRILSSSVEHPAVIDPLGWLQARQSAIVELTPVDALGRIDLDTLRASIDADPASVALVSVMLANNEVGTVQPIAEVVEIAHRHGIPVHTDAVQAVGSLPVDFAASGVDALSFTGHKLGGPMGVGALLTRRELELVPLLHGGGQERDIRSGTIDAPSIAGMATAVELAVKHHPELAERVGRLRDDLVRRVKAEVPEVLYNGDPSSDWERRLPNNAHFSFPGCEGDSLLMLLDAKGIECSTGSACSAGVSQPSHVLLAMGATEATARGSLRFSFGYTSSPADVDAVAEAIGPAVERARAAGLNAAVM